MDYNKPQESGAKAFIDGKARSDNPCDPRTHANANLLWDNGWREQEEKTAVSAYTDDLAESFKQAAEPMMKWLKENSHPHAKVIIDIASAEQLEGMRSHIEH